MGKVVKFRPRKQKKLNFQFKRKHNRKTSNTTVKNVVYFIILCAAVYLAGKII
ncbi:MAG: hypothetical protein H0Z40_08985 [Desulfotomaculum sp.]|nr:hypothetical protein [Desulfotomaculum sp.]